MKKTISLNEFHMPRWNELPDLDLYLEQIVNFINTTLAPLQLDYDDNTSNTILTKTMINNYVKNNLIQPPVKKLYSKIQIAKLFVICLLKQVYSMQEIDKLTKIALNGSSIPEMYNNFCNLFEEALIKAHSKENFIDKINDSEKIYLVKAALLPCAYKMYMKYTLKNL